MLRALAALGVLAVHAYALGGRVVPVQAQHFYDVPLSALASGVWLFFGISGYVISRPFVDRLVSGRPFPDMVPYALRRGMRIFPLYWLALAAVIAIDGAAGTRPWQFPFHLLLLNNLVSGRQEALFPAAWTLTVEVLFYVAVPIAATAARGARRSVAPERLATLVLISWVASIAFTAVSDLQGDSQTGLWLRGSFPAMWQMFCPGLLLAIAPHLKAPGWRRWVVGFPASNAALAVAVGTLLAAALLSADAPLRFGISAYQVLVDSSRPLFAIGYGLVIAAAIRARPWGQRRGGERRRWALRLGLVSYGIYLLHPVIAAFLTREGLAPLPHDTGLAFLVNTAALAALTIPAALLSWSWLEQPAIRLARVLGERWRARRDPQRVPVEDGSSTSAAVGGTEMRSFWNARAREDPFYFVDTRQPYKATDPERFWDAGALVDYVLDGLGVALSAGDTVLEIGCGVGRLTRVLAQRVDRVIAVDVSDEMLAQARALNPELANVRWVLGDGRSLAEVEGQGVDACISVVVFQHLPDPEITLGYVREVGRVLRPNGWAALQLSNDPAVHRPRAGLWWRLKALVGRAPKGQGHPAWIGSPVELPAVRRVARESSLELEKVWGEGSQYCQLLLRKREAGGAPGASAVS